MAYPSYVMYTLQKPLCRRCSKAGPDKKSTNQYLYSLVSPDTLRSPAVFPGRTTTLIPCPNCHDRPPPPQICKVKNSGLTLTSSICNGVFSAHGRQAGHNHSYIPTTRTTMEPCRHRTTEKPPAKRASTASTSSSPIQPRETALAMTCRAERVPKLPLALNYRDSIAAPSNSKTPLTSRSRALKR